MNNNSYRNTLCTVHLQCKRVITDTLKHLNEVILVNDLQVIQLKILFNSEAW